MTGVQTCALPISDLQNLPIPRRDLLPKKAYFFTNTMQISRGCPFQCDFCSVTAFFGHTCRLRPLEEVRAESEDLLEKAGESGCYGLFIGFESLSQRTLQSHHKTTNRADRYKVLVKKIHDQGIGVEGSFIFGSDEDDPSVFHQVVEFCEETKIDAAVFAILTPYPGTRLYEQYTREDRIISRNWDLYDMNHVVFKPRGMSLEQLQEGHDWANQRFYSYPSMLKRFWPIRRCHQVFLPANWGMRRAWNLLAKPTL